MDKELARSQTTYDGPVAHAPVSLENKTDAKKVKVLRDMTAAIAAFDAMEDAQAVEFIVKKLETPPVPTDVEVQQQLFKNALLLIDGGEFALARNVLESILKRNASFVDAVRWMGWCYKQEQDFTNALKYYEQLTQLRVTDQDLFELGEVYYSLKKDSQALSTWIDALGQCDAESPRLFDLHKNLGNVFNRMGDYDAAEENYNKALVLRPHSDVIQVNLGTLNFQRQNFKSSLEAFKRAVEVNPANDRGWCGVALVAREMKDDEWAWGVLLKALDLNPVNQTALHVLTNWAQQDLRWDEAIERVQNYLKMSPTDLDMSYVLAGLFFQKGFVAEAEALLGEIEATAAKTGFLKPEIEELKNIINKQKELRNCKQGVEA